MAKRQLWGYVNEKGEYAIAPKFDGADDFHDGLAAVKVEWARGYIDRSGKMVIEPRFEKAGPFRDGLAQVTADGVMFWIDSKGEKRNAPEDADSREEEKKEEPPYLRRDGDKDGYVDEKGEWVISPIFAQGEPFCGEYARVRKGKTSKWGFIDRKGEFIFKEKFEQAGDFHEGLARVLVKEEG